MVAIAFALAALSQFKSGNRMSIYQKAESQTSRNLSTATPLVSTTAEKLEGPALQAQAASKALPLTKVE